MSNMINDFIKRCASSFVSEKYNFKINIGDTNLAEVFYGNKEYICELMHSNSIFYFTVLTSNIEDVSLDSVSISISENIDLFFSLNNSSWTDYHYLFINEALENKYRLEGLELEGGTLDASYCRDHVFSLISDFIDRSNVDKNEEDSFLKIYSYVIKYLTLEAFHLEMEDIEKKVLSGLL